MKVAKSNHLFQIVYHLQTKAHLLLILRILDLKTYLPFIINHLQKKSYNEPRKKGDSGEFNEE